MFEFRLNFRSGHGGARCLRLSHGFRLVFLLVAGFVAAAMIAAGQIAAIGIVLTVISILGALFDESWHWDATSDYLEHRVGLLGVHWRQSYRKADIAALELRRFGKGKHHRLLRLSFEHASRGSLTLECHRHLPHDSLELAARDLAELWGISLIEIDD